MHTTRCLESYTTDLQLRYGTSKISGTLSFAVRNDMPFTTSSLHRVCFVPLQHCFSTDRERLRMKLRFKALEVSAKKDKDLDLLSRVEEEAKGATDSGKGFGSVPKPAPKKKQKPDQQKQRPFKADLSKGPKETPAQHLEANVVKTLAAIFVVFLAEGLLLAIAGFLPAAWDDFITDYIYPSFSPTLGVFLTISVLYGLVKVFVSLQPSSNSK